jgi:PAS domain S-box-containing protein
VGVAAKKINNNQKGIIQDIAGRKQTEVAPEESEGMFRSLVETSPDLLFQLDRAGRIEYVSPRAITMYGYEPDELIGKHIRTTTPTKEVPKALKALKKVLSGNPLENFELNQKDKAGRIIPTEINVVPIYKEGKIVGAQGAVRNITERKRAEEELRDSEERLKILFEAAPDAIFLCDMKGTFVDGNKRAEEIIGYKRDELIGKNFFKVKVLPKTELPKAIGALSKSIRGRPTGPDEYTLIKKDGSVTPVEISSFPVKIRGKSIVLGIARDISERKGAEEALKESEEKFRNLAEKSPNMIYINVKGRIVYANERCEELMGYTRQEFYESDFDYFTLIAPESRELTKESFNKHMNGEEVATYECILITKEGKEIEAINTTKLIQLAGENAILGIVTDITERKQAERELQSSYDQLRETLIATVNTLASAIEMRDPYTAGHQRRVTVLACAIAEEMGLTENQFDGLRLAALIHDLGKISVPVEILNKSSRISECEFDMIKTHPEAGYDLLKEIEFPWPVAQIVLQHHERLDGSGYPQGLKGKEIMLEARILTVADVVEAMVSHRPYRAALGIEAALQEITNNKGILYDHEVSDACIKLFTERGFTFE